MLQLPVGFAFSARLAGEREEDEVEEGGGDIDNYRPLSRFPLSQHRALSSKRKLFLLLLPLVNKESESTRAFGAKNH